MTDQDTLQAILHLLHHADPTQMRKRELLTEREEVVRLVLEGLEGDQPPTPRFGAPDPDYMRALRLVAAYDGPNSFMRSLQRSLVSYAGLTAAQADAVLAAPYGNDLVQMEQWGVDPDSVAYHWQALDVVREAKARARRILDEPTG